MDAVTNPECNSCYDKYEGSRGNRPHLLGCEIDTKRQSPDQEQHVLLQRVLHDATVDLRPEVFRAVADKGWVLLELHRDAQTLEDVFRALTIGDERRNRRLSASGDADADADEEDERNDDDDSTGAARTHSRDAAKAASEERS